MKTFKQGNLKVGGAGSNFVQWSLWVITKGPSSTSKGLGYMYFCLWGNSTKYQSLFQSKHCILQGITHSHLTPGSVMPPDGCLVWVLNRLFQHFEHPAACGCLGRKGRPHNPTGMLKSNLASAPQHRSKPWRQRFGRNRKYSFITLPGKGGHRGLKP